MRLPALVLAAAALLWSLPAAAVWVRLVAIGPNYAQFEIESPAGRSARTLRPGEDSPEGVRLVALNATHAEVQANGVVQRLSLGQRMAPTAILQADARGHYTAEATINGRRLPVIVDTGATGVSFNRREAERLGLAWQNGRKLTMRTAAGDTAAHLVMLDSVRVGSIELRNVEAVISTLPDAPPITLLGMSFLGRVEMQQSGNRLQLMQLR